MIDALGAREGVSAIIITLEVPLEAEHLFSKWGHVLRACIMMDYTPHLPLTILAIMVRGVLEKINHLKVQYKSFMSACGTYLCFGHFEDQCYLMNLLKLEPKFPDVRQKKSLVASLCCLMGKRVPPTVSCNALMELLCLLITSPLGGSRGRTPKCRCQVAFPPCFCQRGRGQLEDGPRCLSCKQFAQ